MVKTVGLVSIEITKSALLHEHVSSMQKHQTLTTSKPAEWFQNRNFWSRFQTMTEDRPDRTVVLTVTTLSSRKKVSKTRTNCN